MSRWWLTLTDDEPQRLPERTKIEVLGNGVLRIRRYSFSDVLLGESFIAPHAWTEVRSE